MNLLSSAAYGLFSTILFLVVVCGLLILSRLAIDWMFKAFPNIPLSVPYLIVGIVLVFLGITLIIYTEGKL